MSAINHNARLPTTTLGTFAERALMQIMERDRTVLAARASDEADDKLAEMRENMRAAALQRAAVKRQSKSQPVVSPTKRRRTNHA